MTLIAIGSAGHLFTGPIVHWAHGHVVRGFASLGLTLGVPLSIIGIVIATGYAAEPNCRGGLCGVDTIFIGFISGWVASVLAPAVDIAALSYDEVSPLGPEKDKVPQRAGWRPVITGVVPLLGQGRQRRPRARRSILIARLLRSGCKTRRSWFLGRPRCRFAPDRTIPMPVLPGFPMSRRSTWLLCSRPLVTVRLSWRLDRAGAGFCLSVRWLGRRRASWGWRYASSGLDRGNGAGRNARVRAATGRG